MNEPVLAAKQFLDEELAKYGDWRNADKNIRVMFASNRQFQECKKGSAFSSRHHYTQAEQ